MLGLKYTNLLFKDVKTFFIIVKRLFCEFCSMERHTYYRKSYANLAVVARVQNDGNAFPQFIPIVSAFKVI